MLAPEENSEFVNCFVWYVVCYFDNKMTRAGSGLTPKRWWILKQFDKKVAETGCSCDDMFALERELSRSNWSLSMPWATPWGTVGNTRPTQKSLCPVTTTTPGQRSQPTRQRSSVSTFWTYRLNESAFTNVKTSFNNKAKGKGKKTTAAQKNLDQQTPEIMVAFAARAIPTTTRLWLCGQALVGSDGSLWRSQSAAIAIDKAFEAETGASPQDDLPKELEEEYHKATHWMGGATAYRFRKWRGSEEVKPTPELHDLLGLGGPVRSHCMWGCLQCQYEAWYQLLDRQGPGRPVHWKMCQARGRVKYTCTRPQWGCVPLQHPRRHRPSL